MTQTLFEVEPTQPEDEAKLSADRRRTLRQAAAIRQGIHPLGLVFGGVWMHPEANRQACSTDPRNLPLRCGSCHWRELWSAGNRTVPKCTWRSGDDKVMYRASHSVASDVRAWWPACTDYASEVP